MGLAVSVVLTHLTVQRLPVSLSLVQVFLSSQSVRVGHFPDPDAILMSHSSPASSTPLPQTTGQSLSVSELAPEGQQPSLAVALGFTGVLAHLRVQAPPVRVSLVQELPSAQSAVDGHLPAPILMPGSQVSPASSRPLPHLAAQSTSVSDEAPAGQQPSDLPRLGCSGVLTQCLLQPLPPTLSAVQTFMSSQSAGVGHLPGPTMMPGSHCSPSSSSPLPQMILQSESSWELPPGGQQPSPLM